MSGLNFATSQVTGEISGGLHAKDLCPLIGIHTGPMETVVSISTTSLIHRLSMIRSHWPARYVCKLDVELAQSSVSLAALLNVGKPSHSLFGGD